VRIIRIIAALILTVAMLRIARETSRGHPEHIIRSGNGFTLDMMTVPKAPEDSTALVSARITGPMKPDYSAILWYAVEGEDDVENQPAYHPILMAPSDSAPNVYVADLRTGPRGGRTYYYFTVTNRTHAVLAAFRMPDGRPLDVHYIGKVPPSVLIGHIGLMFATVFCVFMAALHALPLLRGGSSSMRPAALFMFWAMLFAFIGGYPFGSAMNWFAFHSIWEGVPFGTDTTDNKTQLFIVYLLFVTLSSIGTLTRGKFGKDLWSPRTFGWITIGAFVLMLAIYLIPHSIQLSATLTYAVCYSFIALMAIVYIFGYARASRLKT
jgi:hypothetical protein